MATLNTGTSIVDYLKSTGKASDYTSRSKLYKESGLEARLGAYTGSADQNVAFLKQLSSTAGPVIPSTPAAPITPTAPVATATPPAPTYANPLEGTSATDALGALGYSVPTGDELVNKALQTPEFQIFKESQANSLMSESAKAEADKMKLEREAIADEKQINDSFGQRGLFFSGMRADDVKSVISNLAASKLGIDRGLAETLLKQNTDLKAKFIDIAANVAEEAKKGRSEALNILEAQGLTISPDGKTLVPTLSAKNSQLSLQREDRIAAQAEESARIANERLRLSEDAAARADARLALSEAADARAQIKLDKLLKEQGLGNTATERLRTELKPIFSEASDGFAAVARPTDGFVDPAVYLRARAQFIAQYPDKAGLFDNTFAPQFLSQEDRTKYGLEKSLSPTDLLLLEATSE